MYILFWKLWAFGSCQKDLLVHIFLNKLPKKIKKSSDMYIWTVDINEIDNDMTIRSSILLSVFNIFGLFQKRLAIGWPNLMKNSDAVTHSVLVKMNL